MNIGSDIKFHPSAEFLTPYANIFEYSFDGEYIDISFSVFNFDALKDRNFKKFFFDYYISIDIIKILKNVFLELIGDLQNDYPIILSL